jgi:hypothetical protein
MRLLRPLLMLLAYKKFRNRGGGASRRRGLF